MTNKRLKIVLSVIAVLAIIAAIVYFQIDTNNTENTNKTLTYQGYLIDEHCIANKKGQEETVKCLQMPVCEKSGYGIAIDTDGEKEKFIKFDENGHKLAKELVDNSSKDKLNKITVKGHYENEKFILEEIKEN
jgi:hypothetical protein